MEHSFNPRFCLYLALSSVLFPGCGIKEANAGNPSPSAEEIKACVATRLPPELKAIDVESEVTSSEGNRVAANLKITAAMREDLLAPLDTMTVLREAGLRFEETQAAVRRIDDLPPPFADAALPLPNPDALKTRFYRLVVQANQQFPIYAKCQAEKVVDRWQFAGLQFGDIPQLKGVLRPQVQGGFLVMGTPEADAAIKRVVAEFNGYPAKLDAAFGNYTGALKEACAPGTRYAGAWRLKSEVFDLIFEFQELKMDGQLIRATLRDPADPEAVRTFTGRLELPGSIKTGPIKLKVDPGSGRRVATDRYGRDWFYKDYEILVVLKLDPNDRRRLLGWRADWDWETASSITMARVGGP